MAELTAAGTKPGLAVIIVGDDSASKVYVANKEKGLPRVAGDFFYIYIERFGFRGGTK